MRHVSLIYRDKTFSQVAQSQGRTEVSFSRAMDRPLAASPTKAASLVCV